MGTVVPSVAWNDSRTTLKSPYLVCSSENRVVIVDVTGIYVAQHLAVDTKLQCMVQLAPTDVVSTIAFTPLRKKGKRRNIVLAVVNGTLIAMQVKQTTSIPLTIAVPNWSVVKPKIQQLILHEETGHLVIRTESA